jgi:hypothetical protein
MRSKAQDSFTTSTIWQCESLQTFSTTYLEEKFSQLACNSSHVTGGELHTSMAGPETKSHAPFGLRPTLSMRNPGTIMKKRQSSRTAIHMQ